MSNDPLINRLIAERQELRTQKLYIEEKLTSLSHEIDRLRNKQPLPSRERPVVHAMPRIPGTPIADLRTTGFKNDEGTDSSHR